MLESVCHNILQSLVRLRYSKLTILKLQIANLLTQSQINCIREEAYHFGFEGLECRIFRTEDTHSLQISSLSNFVLIKSRPFVNTIS